MYTWLLASLAVGLAGCGRISFDITGAASDASTAGDATDAPFDAPADASPDAALGAWGMIRAITELNTAGIDDDPSLTADLLELYFSSDRTPSAGFQDLWVTKRTSTMLPWPTPTRIPELSSVDADISPMVSRDGLMMWFTRDPGTKVMYLSTRANRLAAWGAPVLVGELNTLGENSHLTTDAALTAGVFNSTRSGGNRDLWVTSRPSPSSVWAAPVINSELSTGFEEATPWLLGSGLVIYFGSDRPGGAGGRDIYRARRQSLGTPFTDITPITEVNTGDIDGDAWVSDDERLIYFTRGALADMYEARR